MNRPVPRRLGATAAALAALVVLAALAACTGGSGRSGSSNDRRSGDRPTGAGRPGTLALTVWDSEAGGDRDAEIAELDREFTRGHPGVRIDRVSKSPADLTAGLGRALSGAHPPDVVEVGAGYQGLGAAVQAGRLLPLDGYAKAHRWARRYPRALLDVNRFDPDGSAFGSGHLYGLSQTGDLVGIYYNKRELAALGIPRPRTWADFRHSLRQIRAAGRLPIQFGDRDGPGALHLFEVIQDEAMAGEDIRDLVFGRGHRSWVSPAATTVARTVADWATKGYLPPDANRVGYRDAWTRYTAGAGVYLIAGTGLLPGLQRTMGSGLGFMLPPPARTHAAPVTSGGGGPTWSITARSRHADTAAAYLDLITNAHAADVMTQAGNLPAVPPAVARVPRHTAQSDLVAAWTRVTRRHGLVPYLDYATPTFGDLVTAQVRLLVGGTSSPREVVDALARNYSSFRATR